MVIDRKPTGRTSSVPGGLALGGVVSLGMTLAGSALLAKLVDAGALTWGNVGYGVLVLILAAAFAGAMTAWGRIRRQRVVVCMLSGLLYFALLLSITALFFGGQYEAVGVTAALVLGGSGCAALLGLGQGRGAHRKIKLPRG